MKICELINNNEFSFNPHFKIYQYVSAAWGSNHEGDCILEYDSDSDEDIASEFITADISAINQADDGTVEIEHL